MRHVKIDVLQAEFHQKQKLYKTVETGSGSVSGWSRVAKQAVASEWWWSQMVSQQAGGKLAG